MHPHACLFISVVLGILPACRPATPPASVQPDAAPVAEPPPPAPKAPPAPESFFKGPENPEDPVALFAWIDDYLEQIPRAPKGTLTSRRESRDDHWIVVAYEGKKLRWASASTGEEETHRDPQYPDDIWHTDRLSMDTEYYFFDGELVAVVREDTESFSSNEIGDCWTTKRWEYVYMWKGQLLAQWTEETENDCDGEWDEESSEPPPPEPEFKSTRPDPKSVTLKDDPVVEALTEQARGVTTP